MSKRYYEENFKKQLVNIYNQGNHTYRELHEQYGVSPSIKFNTLEIVSFTWAVLLDTQENPIIELFHSSFKPTSAMDMLNLDFNFYIMLFITLLFSFNELTSYILSSSSHIPVIKVITLLIYFVFIN